MPPEPSTPTRRLGTSVEGGRVEVGLPRVVEDANRQRMKGGGGMPFPRVKMTTTKQTITIFWGEIRRNRVQGCDDPGGTGSRDQSPNHTIGGQTKHERDERATNK